MGDPGLVLTFDYGSFFNSGCVVWLTSSARADSAMRGSSIFFLTRASVRLVGFLLRLVLMPTCTMPRVQRECRSIWNRVGNFSIVLIPSDFEQSLPICKM